MPSDRSTLNSLITQHVLEQVEVQRGGNALDVFDAAGAVTGPDFRNVCARCHISLVERIDRCVRAMGISKRRFLEAAFIEAVQQFERIAEEEGLEIWDEVDGKEHPVAEGKAA